MKKNGSGHASAERYGAVVASVALHAAILSLSFVPWPVAENPSPVSVRLTLIAEPFAAVRPPEPEPESVPEEPVADARVPAPEPVAAPPIPFEIPEPEPPPPAEDDAPQAPPDPEPSEPVVRDEAEPPPPEPAAEPPIVETVPPGVDWEEESRRAAREVVERRARDSGRRTFSFEDLEGERPAPLYPPEAGPSVFDSPSRRPSLLSPGKQRSRAGRWLADKCNSITGGVSVLGMFGLCMDEQVRNDLFASIKPDYLKARPVCTEVADAVMADGTPAKKTHDCRLVVGEE